MITPNHARNRLRTPLLIVTVPVIAFAAVLITRVVKGPTRTSSANADANTIVVKNFALPDPLRVRVGAVVNVKNTDVTPTLTARDGSFNTGALTGNRIAGLTLARRGTFAYYRKIHRYMTGTVEVSG